MGNQKGMRNESGDLVKGEATSLQNFMGVRLHGREGERSKRERGKKDKRGRGMDRAVECGRLTEEGKG